MAVLSVLAASLASAQTGEDTFKEGETVPVEIRLSNPIATGFTLEWEIRPGPEADGTPADESDYSPSFGTIDVSPSDGSVIHLADIQLTANDGVEGPEIFDIHLVGVFNTAPGIDPTRIALGEPRRITIEDDGGAPPPPPNPPPTSFENNDVQPPTLSIDDARASEGNTVTFTVTRDGPTGSRVSVQWMTATDNRPLANAADSADYTPVVIRQTLVFAAGETRKTVTIRTSEDDLHEPDETFLVRLSNAIGASIRRGRGVGTIVDDDERPTLSIDDAGTSEGGAVSFTVTRGGATGNVVTVQWMTAPDDRPGANPADEADYTPVTTKQTLVFAAGETEKTITIRTSEDDLDEPDETFLVRLSDATGALIIRGLGVGTIVDDDERPTLSIDDAGASEGNAVSFTVTRGGATGNVVSVQWMTAPDDRPGANPADAADYTPVITKQTLVFAAGETEKTIAVRTSEDDLDEPDETFLARLDNATGALIIRGQGVGTIVDDDAPPELSIDDAAPVDEGALAVFAVRLSEVSGRTVTANWRTASETATEGADFVGAAGTVTIAPGETTAHLEVVTVDDEQVEAGEETFRVTLSAPVHATLGTATATGTIVDDDRPAAVARLKRVNEALLPRVGSALMRRNLDRMLGCMDHAISGGAAADLPALTGKLARFATARDSGADPSWWEALDGTQLAVRTDGKPSARGALSLCGGGDWLRLQYGGPVRWEGELVGAHVGGTLRLEDDLLVGVDVSHDRGTFDWQDLTDSASGNWRLRLTGVRPYLAWLGADDLRLWVMAGYGSGTVEIGERRGTGGRQSAGVGERSVAVGGSVPVKTGIDGLKGLSTRLRLEGWLNRLEISDNGDLITAVSVSTHGVRGLLEGDWRYDLGDGKHLTPSVWAGLQLDDGIGATGLESGAGLRWEDRRRGLSATLEGRVLVAEGGVREWGVGAGARLGRANGLGPSLHTHVSRGNGTDGTTALWEREAPWRSGDPTAPPSRFAAEVGYGLRTSGGRGVLTPYSGTSLTDLGARRHRVGVRLQVREAVRVALEGEWRAEEDGTRDQRVALVGILSFDGRSGRHGR